MRGCSPGSPAPGRPQRECAATTASPPTPRPATPPWSDAGLSAFSNQSDSWTVIEVEDGVGVGGGCGISVNTDGQTWICYDNGGTSDLDVWNSSDHFTSKTGILMGSEAVAECDINAREEIVIVTTEHATSDDLFVYYSNNSGSNFI